MKIAIVSQYYKPENAIMPVQLAEELAHRGHQVRVLTGFPNYPDGRLYPGYRQRLLHEEEDGRVGVRRVPSFISHSSNPLARILSYLSFALSSTAASGFLRDADVVYVYATPMTVAIGAAWLHRVRKIPFVLHVLDLWPESVTGSSMIASRYVQQLSGAMLTLWLRKLYRKAAATIGSAPGMSELLVDRGVPKSRIHTVFNWAPENLEEQSESTYPRSELGINVMFAGNIGEMQDLETVVRATALVRDLNGFCVTIVGSGVAKGRICDLVKELDLANVRFRDRVPHTEMANHFANSDFQLVTLKDLAIFRATIPSKLQSSLANGIPVITTVTGDVGDLVLAQKVGLVSPPGDPERLADAFRAAHAMTPEDRRAMGERARTYYLASMSRANGIGRIEAILVSAVDGDAKAPSALRH